MGSTRFVISGARLALLCLAMLFAAMPAFAQDTDVTGDENNVDVTREGAETQYNAVCQNIIGSIGDITQNQSGDDDDESEANADSEAVAEVAQEQGVTIEQVNECLNDFDVDDDGVIDVVEIVSVVGGEKVVEVVDGEEVVTVVSEEGEVVATVSASASASAASASGSASAAAVTELPETGGATMLALGAGVMLAGGGLVARRMMR
jgi:LPXTG-motif cell wall-anchored protein